MRTTLGEVRLLISKALNELGSLSGALRKPGSKGGRQFKIGKVEDENRELSTGEVESEFPGAPEAWAEVVPDLYPYFPFDDPRVITQKSAWFRIGSELRVAFKDMPQIELATWNPQRQDWFPMDEQGQVGETVIREEIEPDCWGGTRPDEQYSELLEDDPTYKKKSVMVPDDIKKSISSWQEQMGLSKPMKRGRP